MLLNKYEVYFRGRGLKSFVFFAENQTKAKLVCGAMFEKLRYSVYESSTHNYSICGTFNQLSVNALIRKMKHDKTKNKRPST